MEELIMRRPMLFLIFTLTLLGILIFAGLAAAEHEDDPRTGNMHPMGHDVVPASLFYGPPDVHTDIAFWGKYAIQGNWNGFRIMDIRAPGNPKEISFERCEGDQGDVSVWENIVVRSTNSPNPGSRICDGQPVPSGFEGLHIFDISNIDDPVLIATVPTGCGSHTHTMIPDLSNDRLLIYNNSSSSSCSFIELVEIPLGNPAAAASIAQVPLVNATFCHDGGAILGEANLFACASTPEVNVFDISDPANPVPLFTIVEPGVTSPWHSAAFTWDGEVIILGWEPGGGVAPRCTAGDPIVNKSFFFYDATNGSKIGQWTLPRPQSALENCTLHNLNVVPIRNGGYVLAHGSYQAGTSVVDFSDPANPFEVGYSDPPAIVPIDLGGAWSSYWYNNFIYETNITEGLNVFRLSDNSTASAMRLDHLNPQTQEMTLP
jgi:hypothetical protein